MRKETPPPKREEPPVWPFPTYPLPDSVPPEPRHE
jgi:hypothetical protein